MILAFVFLFVLRGEGFDIIDTVKSGVVFSKLLCGLGGLGMHSSSIP
ncbi:hypothetical protein BPY_18380 [Bifidobacterium psychraerophilum]